MSPQPISRRSVTSGLAWSIPVVAGVAAAPAFAVSPGQCGTIVWTSTSLSGTAGTNGVRTATVTMSNGQTATVAVSQNRTGGLAVPLNKDFQAAAAGSQTSLGTGNTQQGQNNWYSVWPGTTSSVLTLNHRTGTTKTSRASQTLTFTFRAADGTVVTPDYIEFYAYDITSSVHANDTRYPYSDRLSVTNGTLQVLQQDGMVRTNTSGDQVARYDVTSTSISSFGDQQSQMTGNGNYVQLRVTPTAGASNIQLTYSNSSTMTLDPNDNYQYIGIGDVKFCY